MIKGDLIKEEEWKKYLGCVCWFTEDGTLFVFEAGKVLEQGDVIGITFKLYAVTDEWVTISHSNTFFANVSKRLVRVFPIPEEKEEPEDDPYRHLRALKAIGFPQYGRGRTYIRNIGTPDEFKVYDPTMNELMDYYGGEKLTFLRIVDRWWAYGGTPHTEVGGATRKFALMNLIIKLAEYEKKESNIFSSSFRGDCYVPRTHRRDPE